MRLGDIVQRPENLDLPEYLDRKVTIYTGRVTGDRRGGDRLPDQAAAGIDRALISAG
jgi:hypothetical protein